MPEEILAGLPRGVGDESLAPAPRRRYLPLPGATPTEQEELLAAAACNKPNTAAEAGDRLQGSSCRHGQGDHNWKKGAGAKF